MPRDRSKDTGWVAQIATLPFRAVKMRLTAVTKKSGAFRRRDTRMATRKENPASPDSAAVGLAGMQKRQTSQTCLAWVG